jgi:hypothetical protein
MNNSSLFTADRTTHLKIVVLALICATMVAGIGTAARITDVTSNPQMEAGVHKVSKPITASTTGLNTVR